MHGSSNRRQHQILDGRQMSSCHSTNFFAFSKKAGRKMNFLNDLVLNKNVLIKFDIRTVIIILVTHWCISEMQQYTRTNCFGFWANIRLLSYGTKTTNIFKDLFRGYTLKHLAESFLGLSPVF
jgi:hypothetical protein